MKKFSLKDALPVDFSPEWQLWLCKLHFIFSSFPSTSHFFPGLAKQADDEGNHSNKTTRGSCAAPKEGAELQSGQLKPNPHTWGRQEVCSHSSPKSNVAWQDRAVSNP